jgi:hypothetical protein
MADPPNSLRIKPLQPAESAPHNSIVLVSDLGQLETRTHPHREPSGFEALSSARLLRPTEPTVQFWKNLIEVVSRVAGVDV